MSLSTNYCGLINIRWVPNIFMYGISLLGLFNKFNVNWCAISNDNLYWSLSTNLHIFEIDFHFIHEYGYLSMLIQTQLRHSFNKPLHLMNLSLHKGQALRCLQRTTSSERMLIYSERISNQILKIFFFVVKDLFINRGRRIIWNACLF